MEPKDNLLQKLISHETDSFAVTCEMMTHTKVEEGRQFLRAMNNIVDHFWRKTSEEEVNFQIIYIPTCPGWARELLVRFMIHKVAFSNISKFKSIAQTKTQGYINVPAGVSARSKDFQKLQAERVYYRKALRLFSSLDESNQTTTTNGKSLFILQEKDLITRGDDSNPWLDQLYTVNLFEGDNNAIVTCGQTSYDIEKKLKKNRQNIPQIENLFIFHSQNRGKITNSFNIDQIKRFNNYGMRIKNCFVFYITEHPFRLYYALENIKKRLIENLLKREVRRYDDFKGFITFTPDEISHIFSQEKIQSESIIIDDEEREIFTTQIDSHLDELPHNYRIKNALSLTVDSESQDYFLQEFDIEQTSALTDFFNYYSELWNTKIIDQLLSIIEPNKSNAIVIPFGISDIYKKNLHKYLSVDSRNVILIDFNQLKDGVNADVVILMVFRYTDARYKSYPNSFDPLPLKKSQRGYIIINRLSHNKYYEGVKCAYDKDYNGFLFSVFRKEYLGWRIKSFLKPILPEILDYIDEAEVDAREYTAEHCTLVLGNTRYRKLASDKVLYENSERYYISTLKELPFEEGMKLQMLDELVEQIKDNLIKKTTNNSTAERSIRQNPIYGLTEAQVASNVELWKYLLKRKVEVHGLRTVYEDIFATDKEITLNSFERWIDLSNPMILPRSKKSQRNLLTYLGFSIQSSYYLVMLRKKLLKNSNTRLLNSQIETLLQSILTVSSINDNDFEELYELHSDILTLLEIKSADDVKALIELLPIELKPLNEILYD